VNVPSNKTKLGIYQWSYLHHKAVWIAWWTALSGIAVSIGARSLVDRTWPHHGPAWRMNLSYFFCAAALSTFLHLLFYSGWFGVRFRYVALWGVRVASGIRKWLFTGWRATLILFFVMTSARWLHWRLMAPPPHKFSALLSLDSIGRTAAWLAIAALLFWTYKVRRRIVILPVANLTGDESLKATAEGIPSRLLGELVRLTGLYALADEARPTLSGDQARKPTLNIEDAGSALEGVVTADSKIKLGTSVEIPIGALIASVGRVLQGPRLSGSLHKENDSLVLIARIGGGGLIRSWKISSSELASEAATISDVSGMIEQLAYQVFTAVVRVGSPRWRAVRSYSEGLRIYRDQLRSRQDRQLKLRQAEKEFIQALAQDNEFARNYYNLGIVYRDLGWLDSARSCFRKAVEYDVNLFPAYYVLALDSWQVLGKPEDALRYCEQGISLEPESVESWRLKAALLGLKGDRKAIASCEMAVILAWRALCRAVGTSEPTTPQSQMACYCLDDLGDQCAKVGALHDRGTALYRQALYLHPTNAYTHFQLGGLNEKRGDARQAIKNYQQALRILERPMGWAHLARTQAKLFEQTHDESDREACLVSCRNAVNPPSQSESSVLQIIQEVYDQISIYPLDNRIDLIQSTLAAAEPPFTPIPRKQRRWDWGRAFTYIKHGNWYWERGMASKAVNCYTRAIENLEKTYPRELEVQKLFARKADACLADNQLDEAFKAANRAVELVPDDPEVRHVLAQVYYKIGDYDKAEREWQFCLALEPNRSELLQWIATTYQQRARNCHDPEARRQANSKVIALLNQALETVTDNSEIGSLHFWLGVFHRELLQHDQAIQHLVTAMYMRWKPVETMINLGKTYMDVDAHGNAEATFAAAATELKRKHHAGSTASKDRDIAPDTLTLNQALADIYLSWSESYAARGANLKRAENLARHASWSISQLQDGEKTEFLAYQSYCLGVIHLQEGNLAMAIEELEKSDSIANVCCTYMRLFQVYLERARVEPGNRDQLITKARQLVTDMEKADLKGEHKQDTAQFLKDLELLVPIAAPRAAATATGS
jgi:tetratricopeptide (TPR) repeat protein